MKSKNEKINMTPAEVDAKLKELHEKVRSARFALAGSRAKNVKETGTQRKEIARLMTMKNAVAKK
jgi:ribosomal protein L29